MSDKCACGEREECDHSCMPDVIDGVCSHCGERVPGLPILPAGMTNELFYKEQAEYWRQIAIQNQIPAPAQSSPDEFQTLMIAEAHERFPQSNGHSRPAFIAGAKWAKEFLAAQPPAAPVETDPGHDALLDIEEGFDAGEWNNLPETEPCKVCGGSGFSGRGTGYDDVCSECGGLKCLPVSHSSAETEGLIERLLQACVDYERAERTDAKYYRQELEEAKQAIRNAIGGQEG